MLQQLRCAETTGTEAQSSLLRSPAWPRGNVTIDSELVDSCFKDDFFHGLDATVFYVADAFRIVSETCQNVPPLKSEPLSHSHSMAPTFL